MKWASIALVGACLLTCGCGRPDGPRIYAIVGADVMGSGGEIKQRGAVVLTKGSETWVVGPQSDVPLPPDAEIIDGRQAFLRPNTPGVTVEPGQAADFDLVSRSGRTKRSMKDGEWTP